MFRDTPWALFETADALFDGTAAVGSFEIEPESRSVGESSDLIDEANQYCSSSSRETSCKKRDSRRGRALNETPTGDRKSRKENPSKRFNIKRAGALGESPATPRGKNTPSWAIADALTKFAESRTAKSSENAPSNSSERAIVILEQEYCEGLSDSELALAFEVMENEVKARNFCVMKPGKARDIWLRNQTSKMQTFE